MSTTIRSEISKKNKYWIERHRYYELKHFCLQYNIWKKRYSEISLIPDNSNKIIKIKEVKNKESIPRCVEERLYYAMRIKLLEDIAEATDLELGKYILKGVTTGMSYDALNTKFQIPCCRDTYYNLYRKFFWLLDKERA